MAGMVPHPQMPFDDRRDARQRPEIGRETLGSRALEQQALDRDELGAVELRLAPGSPGGAQRGQAAPLPGVVPATGALAAGVQRPSHKGRRFARAEQLRGLESAFL